MFELYLKKPYDLEMRDAKALPPVKNGEVKVRLIYGGICGSDLRVYKGSISYAAYPTRPGHEAVGQIVEAGQGVSHKVGTKVVIFPNTFCGECEFCLQGKTNICTSKKPLGVSIDGIFAQEIVIDSKYVVPVPEDMPDERAVLVEPFAVTVHAVKKANITKGTSVAVIGCGPEGLSAIALASHLGARLTVVDVNPLKLEIAKRLGNVRTMHPNDLKDETFDVVVEAAGVPASVEQAMEVVKPGGIVVAIGITCDPVNFPTLKIVRSEVTIYGSIIYTLKDFAEAIEYLRDPGFHIAPVLSKIVPYTEFRQAFDDALSGNYAKIALKF